jgi:hypothetical protein
LSGAVSKQRKHPPKAAEPGFHGSGAMMCGRRVFGD